MKNSIKDKLFNYMFNTLCKERHSDLIRAVSAMQSGEKRGSKIGSAPKMVQRNDRRDAGT